MDFQYLRTSNFCHLQHHHTSCWGPSPAWLNMWTIFKNSTEYPSSTLKLTNWYMYLKSSAFNSINFPSNNGQNVFVYPINSLHGRKIKYRPTSLGFITNSVLYVKEIELLYHLKKTTCKIHRNGIQMLHLLFGTRVGTQERRTARHCFRSIFCFLLFIFHRFRMPCHLYSGLWNYWWKTMKIIGTKRV